MNGWVPVHVGQTVPPIMPPPSEGGMSEFTKGMLIAAFMIAATALGVTWIARTSPDAIALSRRAGRAPLSVGWAGRR